MLEFRPPPPPVSNAISSLVSLGSARKLVVAA
jgi:hypothetical protein